jgi:Zn-dependent oligopeptidase
MSIRITTVRKELAELESMIEDIEKKIEEIDMESFVNRFNDLKEGVYNTIDDLSYKDRLTQQQEERMEIYENIHQELESIEDDVDILNDIKDKLASIKDIIETLCTTT